MSGTDHPPSTTSPAHLIRRRAPIAGRTAAALALSAGIAVAAATGLDGTAFASASEPFSATTTSLLADRHEVRAQDRGAATLASIEVLAVAVAPTTTVTEPPAPATTAAPAPTSPPPPPPPPPPAPAVQPVASGSGYADPGNPAAWDRLAQCESGGNWAANTGNGYYGGIQFSLSSWQAVGGTGRPDQASRGTQIAMGQRLWDQGGWVHWPACTRQLGYR